MGSGRFIFIFSILDILRHDGAYQWPFERQAARAEIEFKVKRHEILPSGLPIRQTRELANLNAHVQPQKKYCHFLSQQSQLRSFVGRKHVDHIRLRKRRRGEIG